LKLLAQARVAEGEVAERQADLKPEVYLRLESQYGSYNYPGSPTQNRIFVGVSSHFGAGLSSLTQVSGAQARFDAALADVDSTRLSLGEQIQGDYAQAEAGQARLIALVASLDASENIARAWNRQFIAGRKTWLDVMNAVREQAQLEAQIADAKSSQLLLTWRLAIVGRGLDNALLKAEATAKEALGFTAPAPAQAQTQTAADWDAVPYIPLYETSEADTLDLLMASEIDPANLGVGIGISDMPGSETNVEGI
jgi:outer membrane protein TolC